MATQYYHRFPRTISIVGLLTLPLLLFGVWQAYLTNANDVKDWLPSSSSAWDDYAWFLERFGSDEILMVSWQGCTLEDERLDRFAEMLVADIDPDDEWPPLFRHVFTGRQTLADLTSEPAKLSEEDAVERMRGWLIGEDGDTTCAVALASPTGSYAREAAVAYVFDTAEKLGLDRDEIWVGGPTVDSVAIDQATRARFAELLAFASLWGLIAAWRSLKDVRLVTIVFLVAGWAWGASLSLVYLAGTNMDAVLMMMPVLVYVLCISGAVHLTNYYREALVSRDPTQALDWALTRGRTPCILSCITTAIGVGSLAISQIVPVRKFGIFGASGVAIVLFALLILWPAAMYWWIARRGTAARTTQSKSSDNTKHLAWWQPFFNVSVGHKFVVLPLLLLLFPILIYGVLQVRTSAKLEDLLPDSSHLIQSYAHLQEQIGPLVPVEVVVRFDDRDPEDRNELLRRLELVEALRAKIDEQPHVGGTIAASTFLPEIPEPGGARQVVRRRLTAKRVQKNFPSLVELGMVAVDPEHNEELWRLSTRVAAFADVDYGPFLDTLRASVSDFLAENQQEGTTATAIICGGVPLVYMAQEQLLQDLIKSFLLAFALIAVAMSVITRSAIAGMLSMIPNVFPVLVVFGMLGLMHMSVDIGIMMTASVALGVAVDDTMHFLAWFRRGLEDGRDRSTSVHFAYQHCATAVLQTTLICGVGLLVFVLSPFLPIQRFAFFMAVLLATALLSDLLVLPSLLTTRLGRFFEPRAKFASPDMTIAQVDRELVAERRP
ncbi:MAG: MMPL family transporter [Pirellulales bacterium]|nr:MMPL family transporter [Pirellulales bacterium]